MADVGFDSTAIAWAIAHNSEQADSFSNQQKKYRKGVVNGNKGKNPGKLTEDDASVDVDEDTDISIDLDNVVDDNYDGVSDDFLFDNLGGLSIQSQVDEGGEIKNYTLNMSIVNFKSYDQHKYLRAKDCLMFELYDQENTLLLRTYSLVLVRGNYAGHISSYMTNIHINPLAPDISRNAIATYHIIRDISFDWEEDYYSEQPLWNYWGGNLTYTDIDQVVHQLDAYNPNHYPQNFLNTIIRNAKVVTPLKING